MQQARATQELVWEPGSAQVDFGEADFHVNGLYRRMKYPRQSLQPERRISGTAS